MDRKKLFAMYAPIVRRFLRPVKPVRLSGDAYDAWFTNAPAQGLAASPSTEGAVADAAGPAAGAPLCSTCGGKGEIDETLGGGPTSDPHAKCPDCDGKGGHTYSACGEGCCLQGEMCETCEGKGTVRKATEVIAGAIKPGDLVMVRSNSSDDGWHCRKVHARTDSGIWTVNERRAKLEKDNSENDEIYWGMFRLPTDAERAQFAPAQADGWVPHESSPCPLKLGQRFQAKTKDGEIGVIVTCTQATIESSGWVGGPDADYEIVAYRVLP